jgi:hypothetical protein
MTVVIFVCANKHLWFFRRWFYYSLKSTMSLRWYTLSLPLKSRRYHCDSQRSIEVTNNEVHRYFTSFIPETCRKTCTVLEEDILEKSIGHCFTCIQFVQSTHPAHLIFFNFLALIIGYMTKSTSYESPYARDIFSFLFSETRFVF